jgi:VIT1/CCC1 family predicted Fe2+/Mn2+ transporter/rubrerythrin
LVERALTRDASLAMNDPNLEARDRLLNAWRSEVFAAELYELIARRMPPDQADVLRQIAETETGHRARLEQQMRVVGIEPPSTATVRLSPWLRLQARVAPVPRLLALAEASEDDAVDDMYLRPTGDPSTDRLLGELRADERQHSDAFRRLRGGSADGAVRASAPRRAAAPQPTAAEPGDAAPPAPPPTASEPGRTATAPQQRLDRILGRETWHRTGGGWIGGAIYGANDGLAAVFGIVAGVSGATGGSSFVLTAGISGAIASALSMATGAFLAERSEAEVAAANLARERQELLAHPEEEKEELALFYQLKGIDARTAEAMVEQLSRNPDAMLKAMAAEEFGVSGEPNDPKQAAIAAGVATGLGAIIPVIPFFFTTGTVAILTAAVISLIAHFLVGAAKSLVTLRSWWSAGLEMTLAGVIVGGATYLVGLALPT